MKQARAGSRLREWQDREENLRASVKIWERAVARDTAELRKSQEQLDLSRQRLEDHAAIGPTFDTKGKPV